MELLRPSLAEVLPPSPLERVIVGDEGNIINSSEACPRSFPFVVLPFFYFSSFLDYGN